MVVSGMRLNGLSARSQMNEMDEINGRMRRLEEEPKQIRTGQ